MQDVRRLAPKQLKKMTSGSVPVTRARERPSLPIPVGIWELACELGAQSVPTATPAFLQDSHSWDHLLPGVSPWENISEQGWKVPFFSQFHGFRITDSTEQSQRSTGCPKISRICLSISTKDSQVDTKTPTVGINILWAWRHRTTVWGLMQSE